MLRRGQKRKFRGLVPPGYRYLGPFNSLYAGKPTNKNDAVAQKHDWEYYFYEQEGKRPKLQYNQADEDFLNDLKVDDVPTWVADKLFRAKRKAAQVGLLDDIRKKTKYLTPVEQKAEKRQRDQFSPNEILINLKHHKRSKRELFPDEQTPSTTNNDIQNMSDGTGSGSNGKLAETPVDRVNPYEVYRGPPDYTFVTLPFQEDALINDANTAVRDHVFRMTSPYDPQVGNVQTDQNAGAGVQNQNSGNTTMDDGSIRSANWYDFYAGMYKFYHTVSCQYSVFIENYGEPLWVYFMFYNEDIPNPQCSNRDIQLWRGVEYHYVASQYAGVTAKGLKANAWMSMLSDGKIDNVEENTNSSAQTNDLFQTGDNIATSNGSSVIQKFGEYRTGDFQREIKLDENVENWTAVTTNPKLAERLLIRVKPQSERNVTNSANNGGGDCRYRIRVQLNYLVEFKELDVALRYPVRQQPLTVTVNGVNEAAAS
jgi:hypothetical protein